MECSNLIFLYTPSAQLLFFENTVVPLLNHSESLSLSVKNDWSITSRSLKPTLAPKMRFSKQIAVTVALTVPFASAYSLADLPSCAVSLLNHYPK